MYHIQPYESLGGTIFRFFTALHVEQTHAGIFNKSFETMRDHFFSVSNVIRQLMDELFVRQNAR